MLVCSLQLRTARYIPYRQLIRIPVRYGMVWYGMVCFSYRRPYLAVASRCPSPHAVTTSSLPHSTPLLSPLPLLLSATQPNPRHPPLLPLPGDTTTLVGSPPSLLSSASAGTANPISATLVASVSPRVTAGRRLPLFSPSLISLLCPPLGFSHPLLSTALARLAVALFFLCAPQPHPSSIDAAIFLLCFPRPLQPLAAHVVVVLPSRNTRCCRPLLLPPLLPLQPHPCFLLCRCCCCPDLPLATPPRSALLCRSIVAHSNVAAAASHCNAQPSYHGPSQRPLQLPLSRCHTSLVAPNHALLYSAPA
ncbi:hypothetical protein BHE74_00003313 [Ensete ventricosum]|nr:hypothetical protein BHE74_00003313 [Ensete ventricosum]